MKRATREAESFLSQVRDEGIKPDADRRTREEALQRQTERLEAIAEQVRSAVQRGRVSSVELQRMSREIHHFLELMAYEDTATLHLQEDVSAANQFRAMIDQLALHVEDNIADGPPGLRRNMR